MKVTGLMIKDMVKDLKDTPMVIHILDHLKIIKHAEKEPIYGWKEINTKDSGGKDIDMDKVYGKIRLGIFMMDFGKWEKHVGKELWNG